MIFSTIYYRIFYILAFLLISTTATAQGKLELKTEVLGLASDSRAEASGGVPAGGALRYRGRGRL